MNQGRKEQFSKPMTGMLNDAKEIVDAYIPRKCDYTNKVLSSKDKSSVQLVISNVNEDGTKNGTSCTTIVLSGYIRAKGQGAHALDKILRERGILPIQAM